MSGAHCPHCLLELPGARGLPYPPAPIRCLHCKLVIGAGRARAHDEDAEHSARAHGSAAGVLASAARHDEGTALDPSVVTVALRDVAGSVGCPLDRLRMLDYEERAREHPELPSVAGVIATFGTWKQARREATTAGV